MIPSSQLEKLLAAAVSGLLFGGGLAISGMCIPDKVLNFLDVTGNWDPTLAVVMAAALAVAVPVFAWARRRGQTLPSPTSGKVDARLVVGSALFGIGWGIAGVCPGPAIANLAGWGNGAWIFIAAMIAGSQLARLADRSVRAN